MYTRDESKSQLILRRGQRISQGRSARGFDEHDVGRAAARGLADYLEQLSIEWRGGSLVRLQRVTLTYGDPYTPAQGHGQLPCANVIGTGREGDYEQNGLGGAALDLEEVLDTTAILPPGIALQGPALRVWCWSPSTFMGDFDVELWGRSEEERACLLRMVEDAFDPVEWMNGFILELPHYHNVHATYLKVRRRLDDNPTEARRNVYRAYVTVQVHCPQVRILETPQLLANRRQIGVS